MDHELSEYFTFMVPGHQFTPQYRAKMWDGKIRLYNKQTKQIYHGLIPYINKFAEERKYHISYQEEILATKSFSIEEAKDFIETLNLPFEPRDYQIDGFVHGIRNSRTLIVSPTASGKSLICYLLCRFLCDNGRILILVPTTSLVEQLYSDFRDYSRNNDFIIDEKVHRIYAGHEKTSDKKITISTWQSLYTLPADYFKQYDYVIGDECLHPDTQITMADGSKKKICNIEVNDYIKSYNEKTKKIENKRVIKKHENLSLSEDFYEVETKSGAILKITGNHKVLLKTGIWKRVDALEVGDIINSIE